METRTLADVEKMLITQAKFLASVDAKISGTDKKKSLEEYMDAANSLIEAGENKPTASPSKGWNAMKQSCKAGDGSVSIQCSGDMRVSVDETGRKWTHSLSISKGGKATVICSGSHVTINGKDVRMPEGMTGSRVEITDSGVFIDGWVYDQESGEFIKPVEKSFAEFRKALLEIFS